MKRPDYYEDVEAIEVKAGGTGRRCAFLGCDGPMDGRAVQAKYCSAACKQADYRERNT